MDFKIKKPHQKKMIRSALESSGWNFRSSESSLTWWIDEQWQLSSEWTPNVKRLFLTFVFDPIDAEEVWEVFASFEPMESSSDKNIACLHMGNNWEEGLAPFIKTISDYRR